VEHSLSLSHWQLIGLASTDRRTADFFVVDVAAALANETLFLTGKRNGGGKDYSSPVEMFTFGSVFVSPRHINSAAVNRFLFLAEIDGSNWINVLHTEKRGKGLRIVFAAPSGGIYRLICS